LFRTIIFISSIFMLFGLAFAQNRPSPPEGPPSLYFLSVGIEEYDVSSGLTDLYGAVTSAELVGDALMDAGAKFGIILTSKNEDGVRGHAVTRGDVERAIFKLKSQIRRDQPKAPRIVIYMMGHGVGDEPSGLNFLLPGNLRLNFSAFRQTNVFELPYTTIWNMDILSAAIAFRIHPSMDYMDDFFYSQTFPKGGMPWNISPDQTRRQDELNKAIADRRREGRYPPEGNPPVPFIVLFDNCNATVKSDLSIKVPLIFRYQMKALYQNLVNEGLAFYAAPPGSNASTIYVPKRLRKFQATGNYDLMGPLGVRLIDTLRSVGPGASFEKMQQALAANIPVAKDSSWAPYEQSGALINDTKSVRFLPDNPKEIGKILACHGSGKDNDALDCEFL